MMTGLRLADCTTDKLLEDIQLAALVTVTEYPPEPPAMMEEFVDPFCQIYLFQDAWPTLRVETDPLQMTELPKIVALGLESTSKNVLVVTTQPEALVTVTV